MASNNAFSVSTIRAEQHERARLFPGTRMMNPV